MKEEEKAVAGKLHEITQSFRRFYRHSLPAWEKGEGPRPMMIQDMPSILSKKDLVALGTGRVRMETISGPRNILKGEKRGVVVIGYSKVLE